MRTSLAAVVLTLALASSDYPPGLFENSPERDFSGSPPAYKTPPAPTLY
jgi:hypothetical protein